jgi:hypothetical protein
MLAELDAVTETLESIVTSLGADSLLPTDAAELVSRFARLGNLCSSGKAICAKRAVDARLHELAGYRDPAAWLGSLSGESTGRARDALTTASQLGTLPGLNEAVRTGQVSAVQAGIIAGAGAVAPNSETELLKIAEQGSLRELSEAAERAKAGARSAEESEARHRRVHENRSLRSWTSPDGTAHAHLKTTPDALAELLASLESVRKEIFEEARASGRQEPMDAYLADALLEVVTGRRGTGGTRNVVLARIDFDALCRGYLEPGESATIDGVGPLPVSVIRQRIAESGLEVIVTKGADVHSIVHGKRTINAVLLKALWHRDPICVVPGCSASFGLQTDHIDEFHLGGPTRLSNLCRLCTFHHSLKTNRGWEIRGGPGEWRWVAPNGRDDGEPLPPEPADDEPCNPDWDPDAPHGPESPNAPDAPDAPATPDEAQPTTEPEHANAPVPLEYEHPDAHAEDARASDQLSFASSP